MSITTNRRVRVAAGAIAVTLVAALFGSGTPTSAGPPDPLSGLTTSQLAGQRVIYSYAGLTPPEELFDRIRAGEAAGVIFFGENITSQAQIRAVIDDLQAANEESPIDAPLLMMTDQEGGIVRRLPGEPVLSAKWVGAGPHSRQLASEAGTGAGENMLGAGMNVNLAPVLGVYRQPLDFLDQFQRSYGHDAQKVARLGAAFISAQQSTGVAATVKHFPGLGAATASQNTDLGPVTLDLSRRKLRTVDDVPYPPALAAGVDLVMASWAQYPRLDPDWPAGLSRKIVRGRLRNQFGFSGVTITDAMEAGAITPFGTPDENTVRAARVGMDLLLFSAKDTDQGVAGLDALTAALEDGTLDPVHFNESIVRVLALRFSVGAPT